MDRKKLIERIKALMAKTAENGCTEAEAMAALEKVAELMTENDIADTDISFGGESVEKEAYFYKKSNVIPTLLAKAIARFTGCKVWRMVEHGRDPEVVFLGLESDVVLAKWLLGTLSDFVARGLRDYINGMKLDTSRQRTMSRNGFIMGCCSRISARLDELHDASRAVSPAVGGQSLIAIKGALVEEAFAKMGVSLKSTRKSRRICGSSDYAAGQSAGNRANISRPVGGGNGPALIR